MIIIKGNKSIDIINNLFNNQKDINIDNNEIHGKEPIDNLMAESKEIIFLR